MFFSARVVAGAWQKGLSGGGYRRGGSGDRSAATSVSLCPQRTDREWLLRLVEIGTERSVIQVRSQSANHNGDLIAGPPILRASRRRRPGAADNTSNSNADGGVDLILTAE
jgi:hypothetical protein